jgi:hypothetical protein
LPQDGEVQAARRSQIRPRRRHGDKFALHDFMALIVMRKDAEQDTRSRRAADLIAPPRAGRRADRFSGRAVRPADGSGRIA